MRFFSIGRAATVALLVTLGPLGGCGVAAGARQTDSDGGSGTGGGNEAGGNSTDGNESDANATGGNSTGDSETGENAVAVNDSGEFREAEIESQASFWCWEPVPDPPFYDLVAAAKACSNDADCEVFPTYNCCGPGVILGLAKNAASTYSSCAAVVPWILSLPVCPQGLGCASAAYVEIGPPQFGTSVAITLDEVVVRCVHGDSATGACRTSLRDLHEVDGSVLP